jgi:putative hydrolase of the HAD superfamily
MITSVVLDVDDTLYLERDYVRSGFSAVDRVVQERLGVHGFRDAAWDLFLAGERRDIFNQVLRAVDLDDAALVADLVYVYRNHVPAISLLPDAVACLDELTPGCALAIVSDGPLVSQEMKARALRLSQWAAPVVLTESFGPGFGKPHPRAFRTVEAAHRAAGDRCVYVADNPAKDFAGPRDLGWRTVRIRRAGSLHEREPTLDTADQEIRDLSSVMDLVHRSNT